LGFRFCEFLGAAAKPQHRRRLRPDLHQADLADAADHGRIVVAFDMHDGVGDIGRQPGFLNFLLDHGADGRPEGRYRRVGGFRRFRFWRLRRLRLVLGLWLAGRNRGRARFRLGRNLVLGVTRKGGDRTRHGGKQRADQNVAPPIKPAGSEMTETSAHLSTPNAKDHRIVPARILTSSNVCSGLAVCLAQDNGVSERSRRSAGTPRNPIAST
jgi:hypothetical protein